MNHLRNWTRRQTLCAMGWGACSNLLSGSAYTQQSPPPTLPKCRYAPGLLSFSVPKATQTSFFKPTVVIALDRQSFRKRGWAEDQLGRYNDGDDREMRGVFLSMFYALQMCTEEHPWKIEADQMDHGLSSHIAFFANLLYQKRFRIVAYDNLEAISPTAIVMARSSTEYPFSDDRFKAMHALGPGEKGQIYIRTDLPAPFAWELGLPMNQPGSHWRGDKFLISMTHTIGHVAGHCFGIGHFQHAEGIMNDTHRSGTNRWQAPDELPRTIRKVAHRIFG